MAGDCYYPQSGTNDWVEVFETREEAESKVVKKQGPHDLFSKGPRKGQIKREGEWYYYIGERKYDWYEIVDLEEWIRRKEEEENPESL